MIIDFVLVAIIGLVTWNVAAEGAWGAAVLFLSVLLSGLVAMNFFEPVAGLLESMFGTEWAARVDIIALLGLFALGVFGLRMLAERLAPNFIAVHAWVYDVGRWGFGFLTGYVTMAIVLTALHTAPLPRDFLGFAPERKNLFNLAAPDREWLGFVQYVSEKSWYSDDSAIFDSARYQLPGREHDVFPTFIIRYASRRDMFGAAPVATANATQTGPGGAPAPHPVGPVRPGAF